MICDDNELIKGLIGPAKEILNIDLKRHNDASHPVNILQFLIDNGYEENNELKTINDSIENSMIDNGFTVKMNISESFGGTGESINTWIMCDLPIMIYISIKLNNSKIGGKQKIAIERVVRDKEENGFRCTNCGNIGKFRGPGKKDDECPIATLNVLKMLSLTGKNEYPEVKNICIKTIASLWAGRKTRRPYLFAMGTDFRKIKYPMIWYDILNVVNTISYFPQAMKDENILEMYKIIRDKWEKSDFVPESVYQFWKSFDFGQKKNNSEYIKKTIENIIERIEPVKNEAGTIQNT